GYESYQLSELEFPSQINLEITEDTLMEDLANARSLLLSRKRVYGDYRHWWSARPANVRELETLPPSQQVVEQIIAIYQGIDAARETLGPERFLDVRYEAFCQDVQSSLDRIAQFCARQGVSLRSRNAAIPASFPISTGGELAPDLETALQAYLTAQHNRLPHAAP
ncbi:MAG: hypothetical protein DSY55_00655, partial [Clostridia bacterium]